MLQTNVIATFHSISMIPTQPITTTDSTTGPVTDEQFLLTLHPDLQTLLKPYSHIFAKPNNLPSPRDHDHHIHLTPTTTPINIKPYRYPHYQKEAMTKLITEMLHDGIIQPSTSPYSSSISFGVPCSNLLALLSVLAVLIIHNLMAKPRF